jgi:hypothetical protein
MATYEIEVEPIAIAHLTGRLGWAIVTYRGHEYRVTLGGREITRDGYPCGADTLPKAVYAYAVKQYDNLLNAYQMRRDA